MRKKRNLKISAESVEEKVDSVMKMKRTAVLLLYVFHLS